MSEPFLESATVPCTLPVPDAVAEERVGIQGDLNGRVGQYKHIANEHPCEPGCLGRRHSENEIHREVAAPLHEREHPDWLINEIQTSSSPHHQLNSNRVPSTQPLLPSSQTRRFLC